jgi:hypothetical protein
VTALQTAPFDRLQLIATECVRLRWRFSKSKAGVFVRWEGSQGRACGCHPEKPWRSFAFRDNVCPQPIGIGMGEGPNQMSLRSSPTTLEET